MVLNERLPSAGTSCGFLRQLSQHNRDVLVVALLAVKVNLSGAVGAVINPLEAVDYADIKLLVLVFQRKRDVVIIIARPLSDLQNPWILG